MRARALAVAAALCCALGALAVVRASPDTEPRGYDHVSHDGKVSVSGADKLPCADCHRLDRKGRTAGRPGHAECFGACHGEPPAKAARGKKARAPYVIDEARLQMCTACHAPAALEALVAGTTATAPVVYPPYTLEPDHGLGLSHAAHDATPCATCHDRDGQPAGGKGHDRCARCHLAPAAGSAAPPMTACGTCHVDAYGPARGPELGRGPLALTSFSHQGHATAAPTADCRSCHAGIVTATGADLPAPTTADCRSGGCHDGGKAFATTEACTQCHTAAPTGSYQLVLPEQAFSHERHRSRLPDAACAGCHAIDRRGEAPPPGHVACADAACHQRDFESATPTICGACHVAIEPWRQLLTEALPRGETEFGATMPHRRHATHGLSCTGCHQLDTGLRQQRPPRGHSSCTGAGCHDATAASPSPGLSDCVGCHRTGLIAARVKERTTAQFTVRGRFVHQPHRVDAGGTAIACETCHTAAWDVDGIPAAPTKKTCASCHDGKAAFKMTGHGCARCHGQAD